MNYPTTSGGGSGGGYQPMGLMSAPSSSSTGQYNSGGGAPRSAPQATQGRIQQTGNQTRKPAPKKKAKPKPSIPNINKFLAGDTTYNQQKSDLMKQLEQFRTSNTGQQANVKSDFATALKKLSAQRDTDLGNLQNDYAARGLLNSGLYTDAMNQYNTQYNQQTGELATDQQRSLSDLLEALSNYQTENTSSLTAAKADAIRRRAQQYGITS